MIRRFQTRLLVAFLPLLLVLQTLTLAVVYQATRQHIESQSRNALAASRNHFQSWLSETTERLADSSRILATDFGFRGAILSADVPTIRSALENAAVRLGAERVLLVDLQGTITADPANPAGEGRTFPEPALLAAARTGGQAATVLVIDQRILEFVVVPILAPDLTAWMGVGVAIDDATAARLAGQSTIPIDVSFAYQTLPAAPQPVATTLDPDQLDALQDVWSTLPAAPVALAPFQVPEITTLQMGDENFATLFVPLSDPSASTKAYAAIQYSLNAALAPHRPLFWLLILVATGGFLLTAVIVLFIARGVTRPIRDLDAAARRMQTGDYPEPLQLSGADEVGNLAETFNSMIADISSREQRIEYQANHDQWTGLPNRANFERVFAAAIDAAPGSRLLVMLVQLDSFIEINNTLGHASGDRLIADAGKRIDNCLKHGDHIARFGEDKFAILLRNANESMIEVVASRINLAFDGPFTVAGVNVDVTVRVGVALCPEHGDDARAVLRHAEVALGAAHAGMRGHTVYSPVNNPYTADRLSLMSEMRSCMERNELTLHYQPKISLETGAILHVEALIRWHHPVRGNVAPDVFIPIAEASGHIRRLTRWVIVRAIADCRDFRARGYPLTICVNVSAKDLIDPTLPSFIMQELTRQLLEPDALVLEITESAVMDNPDLSLNLLRSLSAMGLRIAIDDFGAGHSSMAYVKKLPATELKIDKSFVTELASNRNDEIIVRAAIDLAHNLGMKVTAEGVEDEATATVLKQMNCDYAQGWHYARALPVAGLLALLQQRGTAKSAEPKIRPIR